MRNRKERHRPARKKKPAPRSGANGYARALSPAELRALAEETARHMLEVSYEEAIAMLDRGELRGTIAEVELTMLRDLMAA